MFEYIYSSNNKIKGIYRCFVRQIGATKQYVPLIFTEHCVECAAPKCYKTCPKYEKRSDGNCVRIEGGITPYIEKNELVTILNFRPWAKIEAQLKSRPLSAKKYLRLYRFILYSGKVLKRIADLVKPHKLSKFITDGWFSYRQKIINLAIKQIEPVDALSLQGIITNDDKPSRLLIDVKADKLLFREAIDLPIGQTKFEIAIPPYDDESKLYFISLHPADAEQSLKLQVNSLELAPRDKRTGKKAKCVIWDLDNTLWNGVLIEDKEVLLNQHFVEIIKDLDAKGIVNSIASKNNLDEVEEKLKQLNLNDYFVFKKINWEPKSINIQRTIRQMNINADTVIFVDDNPFERKEVSSVNPSITCIDPKELDDLLQSQRFDVPVTQDSQRRRETYRMMEAMQTEEEKWTGDIDDFLISCQIKLSISKPTEETLPRCYELLQRTNQLNSSGRRLSMEQVRQIVNSSDYEGYVLRSSDKFGDYGIVGFLIVEKKPTPIVTDFVISCRVANRKIEPTLINYLADKYNGKILFNYKKTSRNGPMFQIIKELNMEKQSENESIETYLHNYDSAYPHIVELKENQSC